MSILRPAGFKVPHTRAECPYCKKRIDTTYSKWRQTWRIRTHTIIRPSRWGGWEGKTCSGAGLIVEDYYFGYGEPA